MISRPLSIWVAAVGLATAFPNTQEPVAPVPMSEASVAAAIDRLGSLEDYNIRMEAGRALRRAAQAAVVPALMSAVRQHDDEYVRYRALVLLAGFGQPSTEALMREMRSDRNDRIRTVAFSWFEHHPNPGILPELVDALASEASEFVRPALTRAIAALGADPRAQAALVPLVSRGEDFFRGAVIEALGDHRAAYALPAIVAVAELEGPLQDDAISAIGKIGDVKARATLAELQRRVPETLQPTVSASLCLMGFDCEEHETFIRRSLEYAAAVEDQQPLLRGAVHAAGMLAARPRDAMVGMLIDAGLDAPETVRAPVALAFGLVAFRQPDAVLRAIQAHPTPRAAVLLLRDAFDMLNEDFEEERFFVHVRRLYWEAPAGSAARETAEVVIQVLEF